MKKLLLLLSILSLILISCASPEEEEETTTEIAITVEDVRGESVDEEPTAEVTITATAEIPVPEEVIEFLPFSISTDLETYLSINLENRNQTTDDIPEPSDELLSILGAREVAVDMGGRFYIENINPEEECPTSRGLDNPIVFSDFRYLTPANYFGGSSDNDHTEYSCKTQGNEDDYIYENDAELITEIVISCQKYILSYSICMSRPTDPDNRVPTGNHNFDGIQRFLYMASYFMGLENPDFDFVKNSVYVSPEKMSLERN